MTIEAFDNLNLDSIRLEMEAFHKLMGKKHGINIGLGCMSYTKGTFTAKITATTREATGGLEMPNAKWAATFIKNAYLMGMRPEDLGKNVTTTSGISGRIIGARPRAKNSIIIDTGRNAFKAVAASTIEGL